MHQDYVVELWLGEIIFVTMDLLGKPFSGNPMQWRNTLGSGHSFFCSIHNTLWSLNPLCLLWGFEANHGGFLNILIDTGHLHTCWVSPKDIGCEIVGDIPVHPHSATIFLGWHLSLQQWHAFPQVTFNRFIPIFKGYKCILMWNTLSDHVPITIHRTSHSYSCLKLKKNSD